MLFESFPFAHSINQFARFELEIINLKTTSAQLTENCKQPKTSKFAYIVIKAHHNCYLTQLSGLLNSNS